MAEVNIPVSDEFTGDANTIRDAIASYLSNNLNTIGDGTNQLEIQPQIQAEGKQDFFFATYNFICTMAWVQLSERTGDGRMREGEGGRGGGH